MCQLLDVELPASRAVRFLWLKLPNLWYFVTVALAKVKVRKENRSQ